MARARTPNRDAVRFFAAKYDVGERTIRRLGLARFIACTEDARLVLIAGVKLQIQKRNNKRSLLEKLTNDEVLIRMRDSMNEREIAGELEKISGALHRLIQISIEGGARAHLTYFTHLVTASGATEAAILMLKQGIQAASGLVRPQ